MKISGLCGVLVPIIGLTTIFLAISFSPSFSWTENWLSDLGGTLVLPPNFPERLQAPRAPASTATTEIIFNSGIAITGVLAFVFTLGLRKSILSPSGRLGALVAIFVSCSLFGVGVFPEPTGIPHLVSSLAFFMSAPICVFYLGAAVMDSTKEPWGYILFILGVISLISGVTLTVGISRAISEFIISLAVSILSIIFGIKLFRHAPNPIIGIPQSDKKSN